jgi:hypothetical protein
LSALRKKPLRRFFLSILQPSKCRLTDHERNLSDPGMSEQ